MPTSSRADVGIRPYGFYLCYHRNRKTFYCHLKKIII